MPSVDLQDDYCGMISSDAKDVFKSTDGQNFMDVLSSITSPMTVVILCRIICTCNSISSKPPPLAFVQSSPLAFVQGLPQASPLHFFSASPRIFSIFPFPHLSNASPPLHFFNKLSPVVTCSSHIFVLYPLSEFVQYPPHTHSCNVSPLHVCPIVFSRNPRFALRFWTLLLCIADRAFHEI